MHGVPLSLMDSAIAFHVTRLRRSSAMNSRNGSNTERNGEPGIERKTKQDLSSHVKRKLDMSCGLLWCLAGSPDFSRKSRRSNRSVLALGKTVQTRGIHEQSYRWFGLGTNVRRVCRRAPRWDCVVTSGLVAAWEREALRAPTLTVDVLMSVAGRRSIAGCRRRRGAWNASDQFACRPRFQVLGGLARTRVRLF